MPARNIRDGIKPKSTGISNPAVRPLRDAYRIAQQSSLLSRVVRNLCFYGLKESEIVGLVSGAIEDAGQSKS